MDPVGQYGNCRMEHEVSFIESERIEVNKYQYLKLELLKKKLETNLGLMNWGLKAFKLKGSRFPIVHLRNQSALSVGEPSMAWNGGSDVRSAISVPTSPWLVLESTLNIWMPVTLWSLLQLIEGCRDCTFWQPLTHIWLHNLNKAVSFLDTMLMVSVQKLWLKEWF